MKYLPVPHFYSSVVVASPVILSVERRIADSGMGILVYQ
jgi:hypothetical protein